MATVVNLPQLGETMDEGTVVDCKVKVGDQVKRGDILFDIETDKATLEMESPADGYVKQIMAVVGQSYKVGTPIIILGEKDEQAGNSPAAKQPAAATTAAPKPAPVEPPKPTPAEPPAKTKASPRAKMLAEQLGVDLATVTGTGPAGRITEEDVQAAATRKTHKQTTPAPAAPSAGAKLGQTVPVSRLQKITAQRMLRSKQEIPCFYLNVKADVTDLVAYRAKLNETSQTKVAYNDFIIRAVATGLDKFPMMTGQLDGDNIKLASSIGIGLAISVPDGLVAPIVKDAGRKTVVEIARYSQALIEKARNNKLSPDDLDGGCITVSNLGAFGIDSFIPIVVPGQCSILGIGKITDTCVPQDGGILARRVMNMTLSVDHKVTNGAYAAQFLDFVRKLLEDPANLK
jgi:pyruvate dehydrogenase E2 component (dihydrolipoamide acetyltransferase)